MKKRLIAVILFPFITIGFAAGVVWVFPWSGVQAGWASAKTFSRWVLQ